MILLCGDGYVGKSAQKFWSEKQRPSIFLPNEFKYPDNALSISEFEKYFQKDNLIFFNCSGPTSVEKSITDAHYYRHQGVLQLERHFSFFEKMGVSPHYIFLSSASVYGDTFLEPAVETSALNPLSPYAEGKQNAEDLLKRIADTYPGKISVLRVTSLFSESLTSRVLGIIKRQVIENKEVRLLGRGEDVRDLMHLDQFLEILERLMEDNGPRSVFEVWNMGSGENFTIEEIVKIAFSANGIPEKYLFNNEVRNFDPRGITVSTSKLISRKLWAPGETRKQLNLYFSNENNAA